MVPRFRDGYCNGECDIGKWTMRLCDFLVDQVGEWDLVVCNSDNLSRFFRVNKHVVSVMAREMQLVFRHRPGGRAVFMSVDKAALLGRSPLHAPRYWDKATKVVQVGHKVLPASTADHAAMQEMMDVTFKEKATRDRKSEDALADRFEVVSCLRSEHPEWWDRFAKRRQASSESGAFLSDFIAVKVGRGEMRRGGVRGGGESHNNCHVKSDFCGGQGGGCGDKYTIGRGLFEHVPFLFAGRGRHCGLTLRS